MKRRLTNYPILTKMSPSRSLAKIDPKPVHTKLLYQVISTCFASKTQKENSQKLLDLLAGNRTHKTQTPHVFKGDNVHSSILIKVESDVVIYHTDMGNYSRAQFHVMGCEFHLPVTSVDMIEMLIKTGENRMTLKQENTDFVLVSLARPFLPWLLSHLNKPHCYAMFAGIVNSFH